MALSFIPCGDKLECSSQSEQTISSSDQHEQHKHQNEACTPFCSCACCATSLVSQQHSTAKVHAFIIPQRKLRYGNDHLNSYILHSVWQPPRVG